MHANEEMLGCYTDPDAGYPYSDPDATSFELCPCAVQRILSEGFSSTWASSLKCH